jgi:hypothetical protein
MIRQLPSRRALVIRGGMSPVIARLPMAWNDPAYRAARHDRRTPDALEAATDLEAVDRLTPWFSGSWSAWDGDGRFDLPPSDSPGSPQ